jgi:hypothetical protein
MLDRLDSRTQSSAAADHRCAAAIRCFARAASALSSDAEPRYFDCQQQKAGCEHAGSAAARAVLSWAQTGSPPLVACATRSALEMRETFQEQLYGIGLAVSTPSC